MEGNAEVSVSLDMWVWFGKPTSLTKPNQRWDIVGSDESHRKALVDGGMDAFGLSGVGSGGWG